MMLSTLLPFALLIYPARIPAQSQPMGTDASVVTVGKILDRTGKPWAGAKIVFLSRLHPICAEESVHRVEAMSNARGKFRVSLEKDRVYLSWGYAPADKHEKRWRLTEIAAPVLPGKVLYLSESEGRKELRLRVHDMRRERKQLTAMLVTSRTGFGKVDLSSVKEGMRFTFPLALDAERKASLPPLPWKELWVEIADHRGLRIYVEKLPTPNDWGEGELGISVHGSRQRKVIANAGAGIKAIESLTLYQRVRGRLQEVLSTKGNLLTVDLPILRPYFEQGRGDIAYSDLELATKGSFRALLTEMKQGKDTLGLGSDKLFVTLYPGRSLRGKTGSSRILILQQDPAERRSSDYMTYAKFPAYEMRSAKDGRFTFSGLGGGHYRLLTLLTARERDALRGKSSIEPQALLATGMLKKDRDLGGLDPARLVRVDLSVSFSDESIGHEVRILLLQQRKLQVRNAVILRSHTDRKGRRRLLLPADEQFDLLLVSKRGQALLTLDLRETKPSSVLPFVVSIPVMPLVRGRVTDSNGKPSVGTQVGWMRSFGGFPRAMGVARLTAEDLTWTWTDGEGRFSIPASSMKGTPFLIAIERRTGSAAYTQVVLNGETLKDVNLKLKPL